MYYQLSRLSLCAVKQKGYKSQFAGSSKFRCMLNDIHLKNNTIDKIENPTEGPTPEIIENKVIEKNTINSKKIK